MRHEERDFQAERLVWPKLWRGKKENKTFGALQRVQHGRMAGLMLHRNLEIIQ